MTREEIEKEAINKLPYTDEECADSNYVLGKNVGFKRGFIAGALWRINSVWHDVSERPKENELVLTEDDYDGKPDYCICQVTFPKWEDDVILFRTKRWAYISDLLPERKEEAINSDCKEIVEIVKNQIDTSASPLTAKIRKGGI